MEWNKFMELINDAVEQLPIQFGAKCEKHFWASF